MNSMLEIETIIKKLEYDEILSTDEMWELIQEKDDKILPKSLFEAVKFELSQNESIFAFEIDETNDSAIIQVAEISHPNNFGTDPFISSDVPIYSLTFE